VPPADPPSANHLKGRGKIPQHIRPFVRCAGRKAAAEESHIAVVRLHLLVQPAMDDDAILPLARSIVLAVVDNVPNFRSGRQIRTK